MNSPSAICCVCGGRSHQCLFDYRGTIGGRDTIFTIPKCAGCHLIFVYPVPTEEALTEFYDTEEYFATYRDNARWKAWNAKHHFLRKLELIERFVPKGRLLDVVTGDRLFPHLAAARGSEAYDLEISRDSARYATEAYCGVKIVRGSLGDGSLAGLVFDVITFVHNLEHYADPGVPLGEAYRMLRPDGVNLAALVGVARFVMGKKAGRWEPTR